MAITINGDGLIDIGGTTSTQGRVRLAEDADNGTNYVELTAPASVASNRVITFPDATTTVVGTDTTQTLTNKTLTSPTINGGTVSSATLTSPTISGTPVVNGSLVVSDTAKSATGSAVEFTGIPPWVKRVTVMFYSLSTTSTNAPRVQLGTASSYEASGYSAGATATSATPVWSGGANIDGFLLTGQVAASTEISGMLVLTNITGNVWVASLAGNNPAGSAICGGGFKSLGGTLTRLQIIPSLGTFDSGTINIIYE